MTTTRRTLLQAAAALALTGSGVAAMAQSGQPIRFLVGFAPGGTSDMVARLLADRVGRLIGQPVVVENRPGAGGRLAVHGLKQAPADGLTYMLAPNAVPVLQELLYPPEVLKFNFLQDFEVVSMVTSFPLVLAVNEDLGVKNVKEFAEWLRKNPGNASFGSAGAGGQTHFTGVRLGKALGVPMQVIPYKGNSAVVADMLGGRLPCAILPPGDVAPHLRSGRIRAIAVFAQERSELLPEVPTLKESGGIAEQIGGPSWMAIWGHAQGPKEQSKKLRDALQQVLADPEVKEVIRKNVAMSAAFMGPEDVVRTYKQELEYWAPIIKESGFKPES